MRKSTGLKILKKTGVPAKKQRVNEPPGITWDEMVDANQAYRAKEGWKDLAVEKTVSTRGVVRRRNINYGRDAQSKLLPKLTGKSGPLLVLNRPLGLSEINQGLIKINAGDLQFEGIPVTVHLPQINKTIEAVIQPEFRFGRGLRNTKFLYKSIAGYKRMLLAELGSDSDKPNIQITFY